MSKRPTRFLHLADIHLGFRQYNNRQRERDFFLAFESAIERYALPIDEESEPQVDFVLIAGDLFDSRSLQPITLSRATSVLAQLKEANIPVFAIEGNHDAARWHRPDEPNWYDYLCGEEMLIYLRDYMEDGEVVLEPWDDESRQGSYYDFNEDIRIIGSHWYGATAQNMIFPLKDAIAKLPHKPFQILMFHGGLVDYVNEMQAGVQYETLLALRECVHYLALGHIHKRYQRQNWVFNPGSLEANKIREYFEPHGAFIIEVDQGELTVAEPRSDFRHRPFIHMRLDCDFCKTPEDVITSLHKLVEEQGRAHLETIQKEWPSDIDFVRPVVQVEFTGALGFPFSQIPLPPAEEWIKETLHCSLLRTVNDTTPLDYGQDDTREDGRIDRERLERHIFQTLFFLDTRYRSHSVALSKFAVDFKKRILQNELSEKEVDDVIEQLQEILHADPESLPPSLLEALLPSDLQPDTESSSQHLPKETHPPPTEAIDEPPTPPEDKPNPNSTRTDLPPSQT